MADGQAGDPIQRLYEEVWNGGNVAVLGEIVARDFVSHDLFSPTGEVQGRDAFGNLVAAVREAFPDLRLTVERRLDLLDRVVCLVIFRGTHAGPFMGIPPTGKHVVAAWVNVLKVEGGAVVEEWFSAGEQQVARQLGLAPAESQPV